jgi:hypothetical protein
MLPCAKTALALLTPEQLSAESGFGEYAERLIITLLLHSSNPFLCRYSSFLISIIVLPPSSTSSIVNQQAVALQLI